MVNVTANIGAKRKFAPGETLPEPYWVTLDEAVEAGLAGVQSYITHTVGPRRVGGRYKSGYWSTEYATLAIMVRVEALAMPRRGGWHRLSAAGVEITEQDLPSASDPSPRVRKHCTAWWNGRDRIVHGAASEYLTDIYRARIVEFVRGNYKRRVYSELELAERAEYNITHELPWCDMDPEFVGTPSLTSPGDYRDFGYTHSVEIQYSSTGARTVIGIKPTGEFTVFMD